MDPAHYSQTGGELVALIRSIQRSAALSNWGPALRAAPEAIVVMAICLRAASKPEARAISIKRAAEDVDGDMIKFPSEFLDTNLQHCSDLGRKSFREAESGMRKLQLDLDNMLGRNGTIRSIARLMDKPSRARHQLRENMNNLQASAYKAKERADNIKQRFDRLLKFVKALSIATSDRQGQASKEQTANEQRTNEENSKIEILERELDDLKEKLVKEQSALGQAEADLRSAEAIVNLAHTESLEAKSQVTNDDINQLVNNTIKDAQARQLGAFKRVRNYWVGASDQEIQNQERIEQEKENQRAQMTQNLLDKRYQADEAAKEHALKALADAKATTDLRKQNYDRTWSDWTNARAAIQSSRNSLINSNTILEQLGKERLEMKQTRQILQESLQALGNFKRRIDEMLAYFTENAALVDSLISSDGPLGRILQTIENVSIESGNSKGASEIQGFVIDLEDREEILQQMLMLEGRLSFVYEMAITYQYVSKKFIIPGVNKMEELADLSDREYSVMVYEFQKWCGDAKAEIDIIASDERKREMDTKVGLVVWERARAMRMVEASATYPNANSDNESD